MKSLMIAATLTLATLTAPTMALSLDMGGLTPTLTFPKPPQPPVSQDISGIHK